MKNLHIYILVALLGIGCGRYNKKTMESERKNCCLSVCCCGILAKFRGGKDKDKQIITLPDYEDNYIKHDDSQDNDSKNNNNDVNNNNNNGGVEDKDTKEQTCLNIKYCSLLKECEMLGIKCNDSIIDEMISAEDKSSINWSRPNNCENLNLKEQVESYMSYVFLHEKDIKKTNRILAYLNKFLKRKIQEEANEQKKEFEKNKKPVFFNLQGVKEFYSNNININGCYFPTYIHNGKGKDRMIFKQFAKGDKITFLYNKLGKIGGKTLYTKDYKNAFIQEIIQKNNNEYRVIIKTEFFDNSYNCIDTTYSISPYDIIVMENVEKENIDELGNENKIEYERNDYTFNIKKGGMPGLQAKSEEDYIISFLRACVYVKDVSKRSYMMKCLLDARKIYNYKKNSNNADLKTLGYNDLQKALDKHHVRDYNLYLYKKRMPRVFNTSCLDKKIDFSLVFGQESLYGDKIEASTSTCIKNTLNDFFSGEIKKVCTIMNIDGHYILVKFKNNNNKNIEVTIEDTMELWQQSQEEYEYNVKKVKTTINKMLELMGK